MSKLVNPGLLFNEFKIETFLGLLIMNVYYFIWRNFNVVSLKLSNEMLFPIVMFPKRLLKSNDYYYNS